MIAFVYQIEIIWESIILNGIYIDMLEAA